MTRLRQRSRATGLSVTVTDALGRRITRGPAAGLGAWLRSAAPASTRGTVTIAIISDASMKRLNRQYRHKDYATDVLSFAAGATGATGSTGLAAPAAPVEPVAPAPLGDIVIARGGAARQAREAGHAIRTEFRVLALHGLLHLLGYDHERDRGDMARLEERLRRRAGLPAGLIVRATRPARPRHA